MRRLTRGTATVRDLTRALDDLGVDAGDEFVVASVATLSGSKLYHLEEHDEDALGAFNGNASDEARKAALANYPRSGKQRHRVLLYAVAAGEHGITSDEVADELHIPLYSAKPRVLELREGGWLARNGQVRPSENGCDVEVHVATDKGHEAVAEREGVHA